MSMVEIPLEDAQAFGVATTPVRDFAAEVAAAYAPKEAAYGLSSTEQIVAEDAKLTTPAYFD